MHNRICLDFHPSFIIGLFKLDLAEKCIFCHCTQVLTEGSMNAILIMITDPFLKHNTEVDDSLRAHLQKDLTTIMNFD